MREHLVVPTANTARTYRRLALFGVVVAFVAFVAGAATFGGERSGGYGRSPLPMFVLGIGFVAAAVAWRRTAERLQQQLRQLASYGRRYAVERVGTDAMERGFGAGWRVVVAQWHDGSGVAREALSEAFDYDPAPLLEASRVQVVADASHPELCMVAGDTLPPRAWRELDGARRALVERHAPTPFGMQSVPVWIPVTLVLLTLAMLAWMLR